MLLNSKRMYMYMLLTSPNFIHMYFRNMHIYMMNKAHLVDWPELETLPHFRSRRIECPPPSVSSVPVLYPRHTCSSCL